MTYEKKTLDLLLNRNAFERFLERSKTSLGKIEERIAVLRKLGELNKKTEKSEEEREEWRQYYDLMYRIGVVEEKLELINRGLSVLTDKQKSALLVRVDLGGDDFIDHCSRFLDLERSSAYRFADQALKKATLEIFGLLGSCD